MQRSLIHPLTPSNEEIGAVRFEVEQKIGQRIHCQAAHLIAVIARLLGEHAQYGKLTVRQVYYQLVSRGVIENSKKSYQNYVHSPYDEEAQNAWKEAKKAIVDTRGSDDLLRWFTAKYGKRKEKRLYDKGWVYRHVCATSECRDCIVLDEDEYFEKLRQRHQENGRSSEKFKFNKED